MALLTLLAPAAFIPLLAAVAAASIGALILTALYRTFFHPLSRFPGPVLAKWSDGYMAYRAWRGDRHLELYRLHERYGPVVRITPNTLSFNSNTALKAVYGHGANVRKADFYTAFPANKNAYNVHSAINKRDHSWKRRVLSHAFSDGALKVMERFIVGNVETGCDVLKATLSGGQRPVPTEKGDGEDGIVSSTTWGETVNAADWCNHLTFDIMGDLAFGKSFNMLTDPTNRFAADLVSMAAHRHLICGTDLLLHRAHLDKLLFPSIATGRQRYLAYSRQQLEERKDPNFDPHRKDFFYYLLQARDPETGKGFKEVELWGESNVLIIAGSDTTSTALAATLHYLLNSPRALATATEQVRTTFTSKDDIVSGPALASGCTYLRACVDEAMRLAPPVPGYLPRHVLKGGIVVDGINVPAGTDVGVPHYVVHHNPMYYPRPFDFIPERWIDGETWPDHSDDSNEATTTSTGESVALAHSAFCPFSLGPRGCIGKSLAYNELMMSLARVLYSFDIRLAPVVTHDAPVMDQQPSEKTDKLGEKLQVCPVAGQQAAGRLSCPFTAKPMAPGEYPLMDTFTSRKDGPMMQVRLRQ